MIKTFRANLADGEQDTIRLSTNNGLTGYRLNKLEIIGPDANQTLEGVIKIYTRAPAAVNDDIDFDDQSLIAAAIWKSTTSANNISGVQVVMEHTIVNQDLFVVYSIGAGTGNMNYYLELEQVKLDLSEATVATLKDMRGTE